MPTFCFEYSVGETRHRISVAPGDFNIDGVPRYCAAVWDSAGFWRSRLGWPPAREFMRPADQERFVGMTLRTFANEQAGHRPWSTSLPPFFEDIREAKATRWANWLNRRES